MRILHINAISGIRSTGRSYLDLAEYLNNNGDEGYIAYASGLPYKKGYKIGKPFEYKIHGLLSRAFGMQAYFSKNGTRNLLSYIDRLDPDLVHLGNLHANFINLELLLTYLARKDLPTVLTLHDCWFFTGKCCHYTVDNCYKWQGQCLNCPRLQKDNPSWFLDRTNKMHRDKKLWLGEIPRLAVVGVSDWLTNEAKKSFLASANIVTRIYNWIDSDVFKPVQTFATRKRLGLNRQFVILGVASGWSNLKGLDKFIELAGLVSKDVSIVLVGNIKTPVRLPDNIIKIKETHNVNELVEYYSMADVFINLSIEETFGKVTAEALACGTPAIVINSTANPELIGDGCGYVVEKDDAAKVLEHLSNIQKQGKAAYSQYCIEYARKSFNKHDRIHDYIVLYDNLIGRGFAKC